MKKVLPDAAERLKTHIWHNTSMKGKNLMNSWLITGGAGFIGQHLTEKIISSEDHLNVVIIDNLDNSANINSPFSRNSNSPHGSIKFYKEDIRNKRALARIIESEKIDTCIHLAARVGIPDSVANPQETISINVQGTSSLLEACSMNRVSNFIFASSAAVYGRSQALPLTEEHAPNPLSPYGASKLAGEGLVSAYGNMKKIRNAISLRIFNVYGRNQSSRYAGVITRFALRLREGKPPIIHGDGQQIRDFISVNDVVASIMAAVRVGLRTEKDEIEGITGSDEKRSSYVCSNIFNIGTGIPTTVNELAAIMIKIYGAHMQPLYRKGKNNGEIKHSYSDITKANRLLGFSPIENIEQGLKDLTRSGLK